MIAALPLAMLPMYDWPEAREATDALWAALREGFRAAGIEAPETLSRGAAEAAWTDPALMLGQTCGLPFMRHLQGRVTLLGAPDYGLEGCAPGFYRSAVVVRAGDPRETLAAFAGARVALNDPGSQSGHAALTHHAAGRVAFGPVRITGAHRTSVRAVAAGAADLAAIDAVAWRLALAHEPAARDLRVLCWTDPTPGLPLIAAAGTDPAPHRAVLAEILPALPEAIRTRLGIRGFVPFDVPDYGIVARRAAAVPPLPAMDSPPARG